MLITIHILVCTFYVALLSVATVSYTKEILTPRYDQHSSLHSKANCPSGEEGDTKLTDHELDRQVRSTDQMYTCNGTPGWRRVVYIDMTNTSYDCPPGLHLTAYSKRTCGRSNPFRQSCSSAIFSVEGFEYSRVCGRIIGYQFGVNTAFEPSEDYDIHEPYLDGVSLTHGPPSSREHIWSFAVGLHEGSDDNAYEQCVCDTSDSDVIPAPSFVGNDYFCESGINEPYSSRAHFNEFFPDDPLWDGDGCISASACCQFNNPPWFSKNLPDTTTDDIELRMCHYYPICETDTPLELIELYIQ